MIGKVQSLQNLMHSYLRLILFRKARGVVLFYVLREK